MESFTNALAVYQTVTSAYETGTVASKKKKLKKMIKLKSSIDTAASPLPVLSN
jgi:hypothetical protein